MSRPMRSLVIDVRFSQREMGQDSIDASIRNAPGDLVGSTWIPRNPTEADLLAGVARALHGLVRALRASGWLVP